MGRIYTGRTGRGAGGSQPDPDFIPNSLCDLGQALSLFYLCFSPCQKGVWKNPHSQLHEGGVLYSISQKGKQAWRGQLDHSYPARKGARQGLNLGLTLGSVF